MTPLVEILQDRISTVACKTLRVSHISHRPDGELINGTFQRPDPTLNKPVSCPKNGEHLLRHSGNPDSIAKQFHQRFIELR